MDLIFSIGWFCQLGLVFHATGSGFSFGSDFVFQLDVGFVNWVWFFMQLDLASLSVRILFFNWMLVSSTGFDRVGSIGLD
jgi:hypothetical protein